MQSKSFTCTLGFFSITEWISFTNRLCVSLSNYKEWQERQMKVNYIWQTCQLTDRPPPAATLLCVPGSFQVSSQMHELHSSALCLTFWMLWRKLIHYSLWIIGRCRFKSYWKVYKILEGLESDSKLFTMQIRYHPTDIEKTVSIDISTDGNVSSH